MDPSKVLNEEERKKYSQKRIRLDPDFPVNGNGSDGPVSETEQSTNQSSPESVVIMDQDLPPAQPSKQTSCTTANKSAVN